jgi:hypothetical protein
MLREGTRSMNIGLPRAKTKPHTNSSLTLITTALNIFPQRNNYKRISYIRQFRLADFFVRRFLLQDLGFEN